MTIGLHETAYSVYETDEYQVVCAEVLSGDIAGRSIDIDYTTESDTAEGRFPGIPVASLYTQESSMIVVSTASPSGGSM